MKSKNIVVDLYLQSNRFKRHALSLLLPALTAHTYSLNVCCKLLENGVFQII